MKAFFNTFELPVTPSVPCGRKDGLCEALLGGLKEKALPLPISTTGVGLHSWPARPEGRRTLSQFNEEQFGSFRDSFDQEPAKHLRQRQRAPLGGAPFFGTMKTIYATIAALRRTLFYVYVPLIRSFLTAQSGGTGRVSRRSFTALAIRDFVLTHIQNRSAEYIRLLGTALRSFLRFFFMSGRMSRDLSTSVPTICKYRHAIPPTFLRPEEVELILAKTDRLTSTGCRDYAILLLLARLGLRAGEIVALELDDLLRRTGEIVVHGKGRIVDRLPLLSEIGDALVTYLRKDRGGSASRRVFLRRWAPRTGLTGPAAIGHIVRAALVRADFHRSGRGAAHLFRHGVATKMSRRGASMAEIAELFRHRSQTTTAIYTQVSFETLRTVALPWSVAGGEK